MRRLITWTALLLASCQQAEFDCEGLPDVVHGPAGLELVAEDEHPGWGEARCLSCHSAERMHVRNCTGIAEVDVAAIRTLVDEQGEAGCAGCHGDNGVSP